MGLRSSFPIGQGSVGVTAPGNRQFVYRTGGLGILEAEGVGLQSGMSNFISFNRSVVPAAA
jgi:hypothetical protein